MGVEGGKGREDTANNPRNLDPSLMTIHSVMVCHDVYSPPKDTCGKDTL